jgi:hypothetical protein
MKFCQSISVSYRLAAKISFSTNLKTWELPPLEAAMMQNSFVLKTTKMYKLDVTPSIPVAWAYVVYEMH